MPWKPANGHHAIERAAASFLFRDGLTPHAHNQVVNVLVADAAKQGLNETMILPPPVQLNFLQAGANPSPIPQQVVGPPAGRSLRRSESNRLVEEVVLTGDVIAYSTYSYTRWNDFASRVNALLPETFRSVSATTAISEVRLEYWDRFDRHPGGDGTEPLVNPGSTLIGSSMRVETGSWHSHVGFFTNVLNDRRTLVNANVDTISSTPSNPQSFFGGVTGQARIYSLAAIQSSDTQNPLGIWETAFNELDRSHHLLKSVLGDIIHPTIASQIGLNAESLRI